MAKAGGLKRAKRPVEEPPAEITIADTAIPEQEAMSCISMLAGKILNHSPSCCAVLMVLDGEDVAMYYLDSPK